jgi:hypothetical protein
MLWLAASVSNHDTQRISSPTSNILKLINNWKLITIIRKVQNHTPSKFQSSIIQYFFLWGPKWFIFFIYLVPWSIIFLKNILKYLFLLFFYASLLKLYIYIKYIYLIFFKWNKKKKTKTFSNTRISGSHTTLKSGLVGIIKKIFVLISFFRAFKPTIITPSIDSLHSLRLVQEHENDGSFLCFSSFHSHLLKPRPSSHSAPWN